MVHCMWRVKTNLTSNYVAYNLVRYAIHDTSFLVLMKDVPLHISAIIHYLIKFTASFFKKKKKKLMHLGCG